MRRAFVVCVLAVGLAAGTATAHVSTSPTVVRVTLGTSDIRLVPSSVVAGRVVFNVANRTRSGRDFEVGGKKTAPIGPGRSATLTGTFAARPYRYVSVGNPPASRLTGLLGVLPACANPQTSTVTASITTNQITLSQTSVPCGTVTFTVSNTDTQDSHDLSFAIATLPTGTTLGRRVPPGGSTTVAVSFPYRGQVYYFCNQPEHAENGESGYLTVR